MAKRGRPRKNPLPESQSPVSPTTPESLPSSPSDAAPTHGSEATDPLPAIPLEPFLPLDEYPPLVSESERELPTLEELDVLKKKVETVKQTSQRQPVLVTDILPPGFKLPRRKAETLGLMFTQLEK